MGRERPRGRRQAPIEPHAFLRPSVQLGRRLAVIAVEAEAVGADGIHDDQQDVTRAGTRNRQPRDRTGFRQSLPPQRNRGRRADYEDKDRQTVAGKTPEPRGVPCEPAAQQPRESDRDEQARQRVERYPQHRPPDRYHGEQKDRESERDPPRTEPVRPGDQQARNHQDRQVRERHGPAEVPPLLVIQGRME